MKRIVFTIRRTAHIVVASIAVELALDFGAGALAVILAPYLGEWVYVAAGVIVVKEVLYRRVARVGREVGSTAVIADAWHHRSDAVSSLAAFVGISIALWGGRGWDAADDWAALVAALVVAVNGIRTLQPAVSALMDEAPDRAMKERALRAASSVDGVRVIEQLNVRGDRPAQPGLAHCDARDDTTGELRGEAATRDFDFGQLWHCATGRLVRGTKYT